MAGLCRLLPAGRGARWYAPLSARNSPVLVGALVAIKASPVVHPPAAVEQLPNFDPATGIAALTRPWGDIDHHPTQADGVVVEHLGAITETTGPG